MSTRFAVRLVPGEPRVRRVAFGIEVLDAVTLEPVHRGLKLVTEGLEREPVVNASGLFVWLGAGLDGLRKLAIEPGALPYGRVERDAAELNLPPLVPPLTRIQLPPSARYAFPAGTTALRGTLLETSVFPDAREPVVDAEVWLRWLDEDGAWGAGPLPSRTNDRGEFATFLRFVPGEQPLRNGGALTVRLRVRRSGLGERESTDLSLAEGRVTDAAPPFAWDDLQP